VKLPESQAATLSEEVVRLRRMVHAMAEMLVECGIVESAMVEGRLRLASEAPLPSLQTEQVPSLKSPGFFTRLWARWFRRAPAMAPLDDDGVVSMAIPPDQTVPVQKLPFEVQSLYDDVGPSQVGSMPRAAAAAAAKPTTVARQRHGTCNRCWRRGQLDTGQVCVRCATSHG
jgi:hypothetical protein